MKSPTAMILDKAINRAIQYDSKALKTLKPHIGKRVALDILPIGPRLHLHITEKGIEVTGAQETKADTTIIGKPTALFAMASSQQRRYDSILADVAEPLVACNATACDRRI